MLDGIANLSTKAIQYHLTNSEERNTKQNVSYRPSVVQCPHDQDKLSNDVDQDADEVEDVHVDP